MKPVTHADARLIAQRFIDGHFGNGEKCDHPRIRIPADPENDDDILLLAYIDQQQEHVKWLEFELNRFQEAGCVAVAERIQNQAKTISRLMTGLHEAIDLLNEVKNGQ